MSGGGQATLAQVVPPRSRSVSYVLYHLDVRFLQAGNWGKDPSVNEVLSLEDGKMTGINPGLTVSVEVEDNALPYSVVTGRSPPTAAPIRCIIVSRSRTNTGI